MLSIFPVSYFGHFKVNWLNNCDFLKWNFLTRSFVNKEVNNEFSLHLSVDKSYEKAGNLTLLGLIQNGIESALKRVCHRGTKPRKNWKPDLVGYTKVGNSCVKQIETELCSSCVFSVIRTCKTISRKFSASSNITVTVAVFEQSYEFKRKHKLQLAFLPHQLTKGVQHSIKTLKSLMCLLKKIETCQSCKLDLDYTRSQILALSFEQSCSVTSQRLLRSGDIESNPGPGPGGAPANRDEQPTNDQTQRRNQDLMVTSYNVRGLNDEAKLRHLINYCYQGQGKNKDSIFCFQETYISTAGKLPFLWRGNSHLTPGRGNSLGCLTLLSSHLNIIASRNIGERGHVLVCQKSCDMSATYIICNLYAPNTNNQEKIDFFESVFDVILEFEQTFACSNILIVGDFNLIFKSTECKNRAYGRSEGQVAAAVKRMIGTANLVDLWADNPRYTWRRPNSEIFSSIDRALFNANLVEVEFLNVNWSLGFSDHAAIEIGFKKLAKESKQRSKIPRLDPSLIKDAAIRQKIIDEVNEMYSKHLSSWNPHLKLEYAKVCIRTVVEKFQADRKRQEKSEEDFLNYEIEIAMSALEKSSSGSNEGLIEYIEELRGKKLILVDKKGKRLAEKLGTKWYNEGEKSNRYFLRLLNRANPDDFVELEGDSGEIIRGESLIEEEIVRFYKKLYEGTDDTINDDDDAFFLHISEVDRQKANGVTQPLSEAELLGVLGTCKDSAPGPDGIPYSYISGLWHLMGPLIIDAWRYSLLIGNLAPSHKLSFLKLIPKAGKDLKKLTNWRPITLSNCDHKLITKTYAKRLGSAVKDCIDERQTAYIKGRQIGDNIRSLLASIQLANNENNIDGLIVSLDAKKAFDSVSHKYIEKCLTEFGMDNFVPIFRILYKDLKSDVIINGKITPGYLIKRGVKQGDALSCILFIMCIEPLLRNVEANILIEPVHSVELNSELPKSYAYADDISVVTCNNAECVQGIFYEYERLTNLSGLELNASKTELLRFKSRANQHEPANFEVEYLNRRHQLATVERVKINGIFLQQNLQRMKEANLDFVSRKIVSNCARWSRRHLCLLGKILILKCFGISQAIYLMQCMSLTDKEVISLNSILYKFLWNRHFEAAKAPERLSRDIINAPIKLGGFGMLNISELDKSLKLRALGRLLVTKHPMLRIIKNNTDLENFFFPKIKTKLDSVAYEGIQLLGEDRRKLWTTDPGQLEANGVALIRELQLKSIVSSAGRNSIAYFNIRRLGATKIADLDRHSLDSIGRFINRSLLDCCRQVVNINLNSDVSVLKECTVIRNKIVDLKSLSSKSIREGRTIVDPICVFKSGIINTPLETLNWAYKLNKLTSTRLKCVLLRVAHREYYTKEKLHRYRLIDDPTCPRCDQIDNYEHKIYSCEYAKRIWSETLKLTNRISQPPQGSTIQTQVLGTHIGSNLMTLTIHSEIINRILYLRDSAEYLLRPKAFVRQTLEYLTRKEKSWEIKRDLEDLLKRLN